MIEDVEIKAFFEFLISNQASSSYTDELKTYVSDAKQSTENKMQFMTWERQRAYDHDAGFEEGAQAKAIENARNLLQKSNLSAEMIADCCSLSLEQVLAIKEELDAEVPCEKAE